MAARWQYRFCTHQSCSLLEYLEPFFGLLNNPFESQHYAYIVTNGTEDAVIKNKLLPFSIPPPTPVSPGESNSSQKKIVCLSDSLVGNSISLANLLFSPISWFIILYHDQPHDLKHGNLALVYSFSSFLPVFETSNYFKSSSCYL